MKSLASLALLLFAPAQEPPPGDGPRGTSQVSAGEVRYDEVTHAATADLPGISAGTDRLPIGSFAEITALGSGRTIVVGIVASDGSPHTVILSKGASAALGLTASTNAIRVRKVAPTAQDVVALREGRAVVRDDAPPALLVALRRKLPAMRQVVVTTAPAKARSKPTPVAKVAIAKPEPKPSPTPAAAPVRRATSGYVVQLAALSSAARATTVAKAVGGSVIAGPPVWRVRLGPYADAAAATRAKAEAARKGYPGGQISRIP